MEIRQINADLKWKQCGQSHPYGDTHRICEIHTKENLSKEDILLLVHNNGKMEKEEFDNTLKDMGTYFRGYYTLQKTYYGYLYHGVEPYDD